MSSLVAMLARDGTNEYFVIPNEREESLTTIIKENSRRNARSG